MHKRSRIKSKNLDFKSSALFSTSLNCMCGQSWVTQTIESLWGEQIAKISCTFCLRNFSFASILRPQIFTDGWGYRVGCVEEAALEKELLSSGLQNPQLYNSSELANILGCAKSYQDSAWPPGVSILLSQHICTALPSLTTAPHQALNILTFWTIQVDFPFDFNKSKCSLSLPPRLLAVEEDR